ncbi:DgyrCDS4893 [Dimorphilus gyrociliatus]|uniref:DgyrCDS4893 n=1 Tax=Dimorphilus gyrociliatus TaxID=2664684 RepID=A0A7I8VI34_9ANNE|nr:DgyrCDS4893 [Dimorphilus gyrociliatus]
MSDRLNNLVNRLEGVTKRLENVSVGNGMGSSPKVNGAPLAANVQNYDSEVVPVLQEYASLSKKIGGDVATHSNLVLDAFNAQRHVIILACKCKQPDDATLAGLIKPLSEKIQAITAFREKNRASKFFNHLSAIGESVTALGWVTVKPTPVPYIREMSDAGQFYTNRVLKDFKEKDTTHVDWVKAWLQTLNKLQGYVKQVYTTGLTWTVQGTNPSSEVGSTSAPPPPGPPPPPQVDDVGSAGDSESSRAALFADLNKGLSVTSGLKKVTDDMKTHKNPNLKSHGVVTGNKTSNATSAAGKSKQEVKKPPMKALQNKKWIVEYFDNDTVTIDKTEPKQTVYIYKCNNTTVQVKGKVNSVVLDTSKKTNVVFDETIATFDVINCQSVKCQVSYKAPTVSIDKTDGCLVYLSKEYANTRIVTAKSSEINISIPEGNDFKEIPIPEQFVTLWDEKKGKFVTSISDIVA